MAHHPSHGGAHDHAHAHHAPGYDAPASLLCAGIGARLAVAGLAIAAIWLVSLWALGA